MIATLLRVGFVLAGTFAMWWVILTDHYGADFSAIVLWPAVFLTLVAAASIADALNYDIPFPPGSGGQEKKD